MTESEDDMECHCKLFACLARRGLCKIISKIFVIDLMLEGTSMLFREPNTSR